MKEITDGPDTLLPKPTNSMGNVVDIKDSELKAMIDRYNRNDELTPVMVDIVSFADSRIDALRNSIVELNSQLICSTNITNILRTALDIAKTYDRNNIYWCDIFNENFSSCGNCSKSDRECNEYRIDRAINCANKMFDLSRLSKNDH